MPPKQKAFEMPLKCHIRHLLIKSEIQLGSGYVLPTTLNVKVTFLAYDTDTLLGSCLFQI